MYIHVQMSGIFHFNQHAAETLETSRAYWEVALEQSGSVAIDLFNGAPRLRYRRFMVHSPLK